MRPAMDIGEHDPTGRGCAIAGRVMRGDTKPTGDACKACLVAHCSWRGCAMPATFTYGAGDNLGGLCGYHAAQFPPTSVKRKEA